MSGITPSPAPSGAANMPNAQAIIGQYVNQGGPAVTTGFTGNAALPVWLGHGGQQVNVPQQFGGKPLPMGTIPGSITEGTPYYTQPAGAAYQLFWSWSPQQQAEWMKLAQEAGLSVHNTVEASNAWNNYVDLAAQQYAAFSAPNSHVSKPLSPWDLIKQDAHYMKSAASAAASKSYNYTTSQTYSPTEMKATANSVYQNELGRDATPGEVAGVSPTVTTTEHRSAKASGSTVNESTSRTDGANVQQELIDQAQQNPHYAEYQAATTYMNALMSALGEI